jgi:thymidylate synthase
MIIIRANNAVGAWRETLISLFHDGSETDNPKYFRDEMVVIELDQPSLEPADPLFPMTQKEMDIINRFIFTGEDEASVSHEWTKLYFHRMFDQPNSQIEYLLEKLQLAEPVGEAQMSLWDKSIDQKQEISPCTSIIWGRKRHQSLELHVHAHSSDAYKKLLMNLQEFISLHQFLAARLGLQMGKYYHVLDSCHIHGADFEVCRQVVANIEAGDSASDTDFLG